jgi:cyclase
LKLRIVARLDIKGPNLIKGVNLEGLRVMGDPREFATRYYRDGIDELIYMDVVASLYGRNNLHDVVRHASHNVFVPLTVGGGVRSVDDANALLRSGADKIALNTAAIKNPRLIEELSSRFGSQCVVLSVEAKRKNQGWEAYTDNGRESTGVDVLTWVREAESLGVGEILLTAVDREGLRRGFDVELTREVSGRVRIPVVASGGMGTYAHFSEVVKAGGAQAVAMADVLHYGRMTVGEIRNLARDDGLPVRSI